MKAICVDDAALILEHTVSQCRQLNIFDDVRGFTHPDEALKYAESESVDLALLDIDMPGMSGIELAERIKSIDPKCSIIFLTAYSEYAVDAFSLHASGYLLKPVSEEKLKSEIDYAMGERISAPALRIKVKTFGNFDIFVDGEAVSFGRNKAKELLAYLVDRNGTGIKRAEAFSVLWEEGIYDHSKQKQLDVIIRSLRATLKDYGIDNIFELKNSTMRIRPELIDCDLYRFLSGDSDAANAYRGEYMTQYSWASPGEANLSRRLTKS